MFICYVPAGILNRHSTEPQSAPAPDSLVANMHLIAHAMQPAIDQLQAGATAASAAIELVDHCEDEVLKTLSTQLMSDTLLLQRSLHATWLTMGCAARLGRVIP
jgi:hypothetical protein